MSVSLSIFKDISNMVFFSYIQSEELFYAKADDLSF